MRTRTLFVLTTVGLVLLPSCRDPQPRAYRITKEATPPPQPSPHMAGTMAPPTETTAATASTAISLTWTAPTPWTTKPLGQMRKGSYALKNADGTEADLSITTFPAGANPLLANINRWRGQVGLAPITESQLPAETTVIANGEFSFTVIDATGSGSRIIGAILYRGDEAWFFKLNGTDASVAPHKPAFLEFLKTVNTR